MEVVVLHQKYLRRLEMMSKVSLLSLDLKTNVKSELSILNVFHKQKVL